MKALKTLLPIAAAVAALAAPVAANAGVSIRISDGANTVTIDDGGLGDLTPAMGIVSHVLLGWNGYDISTTTGTSLTDPLNMHLSATFSSSNVAATSRLLTISVTHTDLTAGSPGLINFTGIGGGFADGISTWSMFADDTNAKFGTATLLYTGPVPGTGGGVASMTGLYSATMVASFDLSSVTATGAAGSQDNRMRVPEPATIALAGLALLGLGAARRRKA